VKFIKHFKGRGQAIEVWETMLYTQERKVPLQTEMVPNTCPYSETSRCKQVPAAAWYCLAMQPCKF
jgi:hypothetical protein